MGSRKATELVKTSSLSFRQRLIFSLLFVLIDYIGYLCASVGQMVDQSTAYLPWSKVYELNEPRPLWSYATIGAIAGGVARMSVLGVITVFTIANRFVARQMPSRVHCVSVCDAYPLARN